MTPETETPILRVEDLEVEFFTDAVMVKAVDGVGLEIREGEVVALVGESGSGKTVTATAIMRLVPEPPGKISGGRILLDGENLLALDDDAMRRVRGRTVAMVFQEPGSALNPVLTVGYQVAGVVRHHHGVSGAEARKRALGLLEEVRIPDASTRFGAYPHELSGGMQQRVTIAMALAGRPRLLVADEPTASLDVTVQAQILHLLRDLRRESRMSILLITHDLGVVNELADHVVVMYAGTLVEEGSRTEILGSPRHPYTQGLVQTVPTRFRAGARLAEIEGRAPAPGERQAGCRFAPRCDRAMPICAAVEPGPTRLSARHRAWCHAVEREETR